MDITKVTNKETKFFLTQFLGHRKINVEFYKKVPEDKLDFRLVDNPTKKSDSVRESLGHQIGVEVDYLNALETGKLEFVSGDDASLKALAREEQLAKLKDLDEQLRGKLSDPNIAKKLVMVPWSKEPVSAIVMLYGMNDHEILHTGWNLALMDVLDIERFPALKEVWG